MSVRRLPTKSVRWEVVLELGIDPETGKRRQERINRDPLTTLPIPTKKRAKEIEADELVKRRRPGYVDPTTLTVAAHLERWLTETRDGRAESTHYNLVSLVKTRLTPALGPLLLADLTPLHLQAFYREQAGRYAHGSLQRTRAVLSAALRAAVRWRLLETNPHDGVTLPRGQTAPRPVWTAAEARRFLAATREARWGALWRLLLDTGMRIGEAIALTWVDVDLAAATVRVDKTVAVTTGGKRTVVPGGKTAHARRTLAIAPETAAALKAHRARQNARRLALGEYWRDGDLVFDRHDGGVIDATLLRRALAQDIAAAGVPPLTPHGMRHTMATAAIAAGAPLHAVAKRLGHRNVNLTMNLYGHMSPDADRQAMQAMAKALQG